MDVANAFRAWIDAAANRHKPGLSALLAPTVYYNDRAMDPFANLDAFIEATVSSEIESTDVDMIVIDDSRRKLAARLIHRGSVGEGRVGGHTSCVEWAKHVFVWFDEDGKVKRVQSLADTQLLDDIRQKGISSNKVPQTPERGTDHESTTSFSSAEKMAAAYRAYIDSINTHTMHGHFPSFVQPEVTHNTRPLSLSQYAGFIETSFEEIQGLVFHLREVVCDTERQQVAAWIEFTGTPLTDFRGVRPTGRSVRFTEQVLYRLRDGKIELVWSLLDLETYKKCLSGEIDAGVSE